MSDMAALRDYITAKDGIEYEDVSETTVLLNVLHSNLSRKIAEIRFDMHSTIADVKYKLYKHSGTKPDAMKLFLTDGAHVICPMLEESKKLGYYPVQHGLTIYIEDLDPFSLARGGGLDDVSLIKKYEISEEDYDKRKKTVRNYKREQLAKDPNWKPPVLGGAKSSSSDVSTGPETLEGLKLGDRCEVSPGARRGSIAYLGLAEELQGGGNWVGVIFDEPVGKTNGTVKGKCYFKCADKYGGFIRPRNLTVGDFPEIDPFAESDQDEI